MLEGGKVGWQQRVDGELTAGQGGAAAQIVSSGAWGPRASQEEGLDGGRSVAPKQLVKLGQHARQHGAHSTLGAFPLFSACLVVVHKRVALEQLVELGQRAVEQVPDGGVVGQHQAADAVGGPHVGALARQRHLQGRDKRRCDN